MRSLTPPLVALCAAVVLFADAARADDKAACMASYERSQVLRRQNKLRDAREELLVCARASCPKLAQKDCAQWMNEVNGMLPSLIFEARDAQGRDRADVRVSIDGAAVQEQLGQEVTVDPGPHKLRFESEGSAATEQDVVVRIGEKGRIVTIQFPEPSPPAAPLAKDTITTKEKVRESRPLPVLSPVIGALGLMAVGGGTYLALSASSQLKQLRDTCAPHCEQSDVNRVNLRYRVAGGVIGVGVVAIGFAVLLYVTRGTTHERAAAMAALPFTGVAIP